MKIAALVLCAALLAGCQTRVVYRVPDFPKPPAELMQKPEPATQLNRP